MANHSTPVNPVVTKVVSIAAAPHVVWQAITEPEALEQWMAEGGLRVTSGQTLGSTFSITAQLNGTPYHSSGTILIWEPPMRFQYNYWNPISRLPDLPENYSILDFTLAPEASGTTLTFTQHTFKGEATYEHANYYWGVALQVLKRFVEKNGKP